MMVWNIRRAGRYTAAAACALSLAAAAAATPPVKPNTTPPPPPVGPPPPMVLTYHNDNARTGMNMSESVLNPSNVRDGYTDIHTGKTMVFGKQFSIPVDGAIYGQPLYVSNVTCHPSWSTGSFNGNVILVATANNTVYAYQDNANLASNARPLWVLNYNIPIIDVGPVPSDDIPTTDIAPQIGITGTPVINYNINTRSATIFFVVRTKESGAYFQRLHAVDVGTGIEVPGSAMIISPSVPGNGDGALGGSLGLDPLYENQRPALTYANGLVYVAWGTHDNTDPTHGWIASYSWNGTAFTQVGVYATSANGSRAGINMAGSGPAVDSAGNLYVTTGNGTFDGNTGGGDFAQSVLKMPSGLTGPSSYFTPFDWNDLNSVLEDLGTGGPVVLPDPGTATGVGTKRMVVAAGLEGTVYLLNRDALGGFNSSGDTQIIQSLQNAIGGQFGPPAYYNNNVYFCGTGDVVEQYYLSGGLLSTSPIKRSPDQPFEYPGAVPVVSGYQAPGSNPINGLVWVLEPYYPPPSSPLFAGGPPVSVLHAYNANSVALEVYNSADAGGRDAGPVAVPSAVPTVANGRVFVPGQGALTVYGFIPVTAPTADHFLITGVEFIPAFLFFPAEEDRRTYSYSITSVGGNGQPMPLTSTILLGYQSIFGGSVIPFGSVTFNNNSNQIFSNTNINPGDWFWIATDASGVNKAVPTAEWADIGQFYGLDHYAISGPSSAKVGVPFFINVRAQSLQNTPVAVTDNLIIYNTNPQGTQVDVPFNAVGQLRSDFGYDNQYGLTTLPWIFTGTSMNIPVTLHYKGASVLIVTNGLNTGTVVINGY